MTKNYPSPDLNVFRKLIVGEGESDFKFLKAFCAANGITKFAFAFAGMHNKNYEPSGFQEYGKYLTELEKVGGFENLSDLVLMCDSAESSDLCFSRLCRYLDEINRAFGRVVYPLPVAKNTVTPRGLPRVHIVTVPPNDNGGIETLCVIVARDHLNGGDPSGAQIEGWVDKFADDACAGWTKEKRDKLRLQAFLSAAFGKKPDVHFSQIFDLTKGKFIPLTGPAFDEIRGFLKDVEAL